MMSLPKASLRMDFDINGIGIFDWIAREGKTPLIMAEWLARHETTAKTSRQFIGDTNDLTLQREALDRGYLTQDDLLDYQEDRKERKTWGFTMHYGKTEESAKEARHIYRLIVAVNLDSQSTADHFAALLVSYGYSQKAITEIRS